MNYNGYFINTVKQEYCGYGEGFGIYFEEGCLAALTVTDSISTAMDVIDSGLIKNFH